MMKTTASDLCLALRGLGVKPGDAVFLHSHLPAFGLFEGGPRGLVAALLEAVGPTGTLAMPGFTLGFPKTRRFDLENTPSEMGVLTEEFRKTPGVLRSLHPIHSVLAAGASASLITGGWCASSFGPGSAFERLHGLDAWLLCAGVGAERLTFVHYVEECVQVPYRAFKAFPGTVLCGGRADERTYAMYARDLRFKVDVERFPAILEGLGVGSAAPLAYGSLKAWRAKGLFAAVQGLLAREPSALLAAGAPFKELVSGAITCAP